MSKQASGGNQKRPRRPRAAHKIFAQGKRKEKWLRKLEANPKAQHSRKREKAFDISHEHITPKDIRPATLEDMYRSYRVTKGRQGLNPNPDTRKEENYWVTHPSITRFPIIELMEKPIMYSKPKKTDY